MRDVADWPFGRIESRAVLADHLQQGGSKAPGARQ